MNVSALATSSESSIGKAEKQSVYRKAIANGIVEILSVYRSAVLHIEQKLLSETVPILATVTQGLNKVVYCFPYNFSFWYLDDQNLKKVNVFCWAVFCSFTTFVRARS